MDLASERPLPAHLASVVPDPGRPRVDEAPSLEKPNPEKTPRNRSVLQAHAAFFDFDGDGILSLSDTFKGMRATGFNVVLAALGTAIIHASFSLPTTPHVEVRLPWFLNFSRRRGTQSEQRQNPSLFSLRLPDPFLRVFISNVHKGKHGSDSGTYDTEGRFVPERLEECFSKYAGKGDASSSSSPSSVSMTPVEVAKKKAAAAAASLTLDETKGKASAGSVVDVGPRDSLTWADIRLMLKGNRALFDPFGATAAILEWGGLFWLAAQRRACDGRFVVTRERARAAADGTLFAVLKADRELAMADAKKKKEEVGGRSRGGGGKAATTPATAAKKRSSPAEAGGAPPSSSAGKGIPAGRRTPPPATKVDLADPSSHPASAKKAQ